MNKIIETGFRPHNKLDKSKVPFKGFSDRDVIDTDPIDNPHHYLIGNIEVNDIIKAKLTAAEYQGWLKGNILKYTLRAPWKEVNQTKDLRKMLKYSEFLKEWLQQTGLEVYDSK